jgi:hypothetical protein
MTSASAGRSHGGFWADGRIHQRLAFESDGVLGVARTRALQRAELGAAARASGGHALRKHAATISRWAALALSRHNSRLA